MRFDRDDTAIAPDLVQVEAGPDRIARVVERSAAGGDHVERTGGRGQAAAHAQMDVAEQQHPQNWKGGLTPERQEFYATQEWKDAVKAVWKRDKCCCVICSKNVSHKRGETAIHHIESFANKKKRAKVSNLILLCKPCHLWVHSNANKNKDYIK